MASARGGGEDGSRGSMYDVFVSFRGPDTRDGFVDCLYEHMTLAGIRVFVDNERLHVGEVIGEELMRAIDDSKICILVFSKRYASSKWCLLELERIMMDRPGQEVLPVFYDVSPDAVKLKTRQYSDDLEALEKEHGRDVVDGWRNCLKEVGKIKGWNTEESKGQGKLIQRIVKEVLCKTKKRHKNLSDHLVGIEGQVEVIKKLLDDQNDCVRFVVIHGMGGIGKTTLAKVIFNEVSENFHGCSFISNIRESSQGNGIVRLQQQILNNVLRTLVSIQDVDDGINEIRARCSNKKVLLVLDDVDQSDQVRKLAGMFDWFGRGSRIIITTRDHTVIRLLSHDARGKNRKQQMEREDDAGNVCFYKMQEMNDENAMNLFKRHAISDDDNSFDDGDLLDGIVATTGGLPLALEVVGSYLFGQTKAVWRETLRKLKRSPPKEVQNALMISYESLDNNEKQIFLDIACFFWGMEKWLPMYMWEASNLYPDSGINALLHKSLIKIVDGDEISMHDHLIDLGREIVSRESKPSRIWIHEEAFGMISERKGTGDVILLDLGDLPESHKFRKAHFKELVNLRVLELSGGNLVGDFSNCFPQLRWLKWISFPSNFQAKDFSPPNLVILILENTDITERSTIWKQLPGSELKGLELSDCGRLTRTPDLSACLGLKMLVLVRCQRLTEIDSSIGKLEQLTHLEIRESPNLKTLPLSLVSLQRIEKLIVSRRFPGKHPLKFHLSVGFDHLKSLTHLALENVGLESLSEGIGRLQLLEYLSLDGCADLMSLPESVWELESLTELNLSTTGLTGFSGQIENMKHLKVLNISDTKIRMLPEGIGSLAKLEELHLRWCRHLEQIPSEIGNLFSLRVLDLTGTIIRELPSTVSRLSRLQRLNMSSCFKLRKVDQLPASLSILRLPYFSLQVLPDLSNLVNLVHLSLIRGEVSFYSDRYTGMDVEEVDVDLHTRFRSIDFSWIKRLHQLKRLIIGVPIHIYDSLRVDFSSVSSSAELFLSCSEEQSLSQLPPNLSRLVLTMSRATSLDLSLYPNLKNLSEIRILNSLAEEIELRGLEALGNLQWINVANCQYLERLSISSCPKNLNFLNVRGCQKLVEIRGVDRMVSLHQLGLVRCPSLPGLPDLSGLVNIRGLRMVSCDSMESMPSLPITEHRFSLDVRDSGELPDFNGPHNLYRERVKGRNELQGLMCPNPMFYHVCTISVLLITLLEVFKQSL